VATSGQLQYEPEDQAEIAWDSPLCRTPLAFVGTGIEASVGVLGILLLTGRTDAVGSIGGFNLTNRAASCLLPLPA
jgi:hypothetical protein